MLAIFREHAGGFQPGFGLVGEVLSVKDAYPIGRDGAWTPTNFTTPTPLTTAETCPVRRQARRTPETAGHRAVRPVWSPPRSPSPSVQARSVRPGRSPSTTARPGPSTPVRSCRAPPAG